MTTPKKPTTPGTVAKAAKTPRARAARAAAQPTETRGPGRPAKVRKPGREYIVEYLATSGPPLPKTRRVFAADPSEAIVEAHRLNKITATHAFNTRARAVDGTDSDVSDADDETFAADVQTDEAGNPVPETAENDDDAGDDQ